MQISIRPRPIVTVRPEIKVHRPPEEYIDLLNKNETEFRRLISDVESNSAFEKLMQEGLVKKINFKGRVPYHLYQEYQDKQFVEFLQKYDITNRIGWEEDFFHKDARRKVKDLAIKYKVPNGELRKSLEYCRHLKLTWEGLDDDPSNSFISLDNPENFRSPAVQNITSQSTESLENLSKLLEDNSISEDDFTEYFLSGSQDPYDIARELDIDLDTIQEILEALEEVQLLSVMQVNVVDDNDFQREPKTQIIAVIKRQKNPPRAEIQIDSTQQYGFRYEISDPDINLAKEEIALIEKLRMINQRRALTFRVINFIYDFQYPYFVSGNELYLKPLSQAQISKEMGEHESTISRILKNKSIETPEGIFNLKFFCQSKKDVIKRLITIREKTEIAKDLRNKPFSDSEMADILEKEYSTKISRRTVTYYRNKIKETPKFYTRKRKADDHNL